MKNYEYIFIGILISLVISSSVLAYFQINPFIIMIFGVIPAIFFTLVIINRHDRHSSESMRE